MKQYYNCLKAEHTLGTLYMIEMRNIRIGASYNHEELLFRQIVNFKATLNYHSEVIECFVLSGLTTK